MLCRAAKTKTRTKPCITRLCILLPLAFQDSLVCAPVCSFLLPIPWEKRFPLTMSSPEEQKWGLQAAFDTEEATAENSCTQKIFFSHLKICIQKLYGGREICLRIWNICSDALVLLWWLAPWSRGDGSQMMLLRRFADLKSGICENLVRIRGMCLNRWYVKNFGIEWFSENL